ncbi:nucleolar protein 8 [Aplochiton taeniatus]
MKRLYIGGLGHTITQKDLKDRFGKFGNVQDVELVTRNDDEGAPIKTFGYINLEISDVDFKRCLTVLNHSKWKGGTLQIEAARESFLQKLAQERHELSEQKIPAPSVDQKQRLLESLREAGVEDFHMKAAVPGTEVPGHKDWVVSKFGRVLPILHLRPQGRKKVVKCDPSKHSHNIKKLDSSADQVSVSQLTWEIQGGDDDISRKRRGQFPPQKPRPKKPRAELPACAAAQSNGSLEKTPLTNGKSRPAATCTQTPYPNSAPQRPKAVCVFHSDSDEEIRTLAAQQQTSHGALLQEEEEEDDALEVVGDDYGVSFPAPMEEEDYDSADTDEILTSRKTPVSPPPETPASGLSSKEKKSVSSSCSKQETSNNTALLNQSEVDTSAVETTKPKKERKKAVPVAKPPPPSESDSEEEEEEEEEDDSDYEAMFSNCIRLEVSLSDLQHLAEEARLSEGEGSSQSPEEPPPPTPSAPSTKPTKVGTTPDEILASILEDDSSGDEPPGKKKKKKKGTKALEEHPEPEAGLKRQHQGEEDRTEGFSQKHKAGETPRTLDSNVKAVSFTHNPAVTVQISGGKCSSESSEEEEDVEIVAPVTSSRRPPSAAGLLDSEKQQQDNQKRLAAVEQRQREAESQKKLIQGALSKLEAPAPSTGQHIVFGSDEEAEDSFSQTPTPRKVLFQDSQLEEEESHTKTSLTNQKAAIKEKDSRKLFDNSDDEDEGDEEEEDGQRFQLKPQFEGKSGQKLMKLQSTFGTDQRFHLDSRFLESDEEEGEEGKPNEGPEKRKEGEMELQEEKKRSLDILQSMLNVSIQPSDAKPASKSKAFRDVSALHYDPTKEEHAAFETKTEEKKKESKQARRKKREEAEKLPEVSKEIFYNVAVDLKTVFGPAEEISVPQEKTTVSWDKKEEEEDEEGEAMAQGALPSFLSADSSGVTQQPAGGFTFSFFADNTTTGSTAEKAPPAPYKVETIHGPKVSWQADPRFQDSSSEEEEEEQKEVQEEQANSTTPEEPTPQKKKAFFFFLPDDERLREGPELFCRKSTLENQREEWQDKRSALIQEYRKKHKDAKRKLGGSHRK